MMNIYTHKTDAMGRLQRLLASGYTRYISGEISTSKALALACKFSDRYDINANRQKRNREKAKGNANSFLILLKNDQSIHWWLVVSEGDGLVTELETLKDANQKSSRIIYTGYELVKTPRIGKPASWTWRMTESNYKHWLFRINRSIRHKNDQKIRQFLYSLRRVPGFREIRSQAYSIEKAAKAEWKRTMKGPWEAPNLFIGFKGRFKAAETITFEELGK